MSKTKKGEMTVREMGRLGGKARAAKCTPEELSAIGRLGRQALDAKYTHEELCHFQRNAGRPPYELTVKKLERLKRLLKSGWHLGQIAKALGVSTWIVSRHVRRLQEARVEK
jgi:DNA-binding NarL/FixJ family response regulator